MQKSQTELMLKGYGLTTAEMIYHMPDHPHVLNSFIWQEYDLAPPDHDRLLDLSPFGRAKLTGHCIRCALPIAK